MLNVILSLGLGAALIAALVAWIRTHGPRFHQIDSAEIHPDLAAGEELLRDALQEAERETKL